MSTVELPRFEIFYWNFKKSLTFRLKRIIQKIVANVIAEVSSARDEIFFDIEKDVSFIYFFFFHLQDISYYRNGWNCNILHFIFYNLFLRYYLYDIFYCNID